MKANKTKTYITKDGLLKLQKELDDLRNTDREDVVQQIKEARAQGDLSENADYTTAKEHQGVIEGRIKELENIIENVEIIEEGVSSDFVRLGSKVEIKELDTGNKLTFRIVGSEEADPLNSMISYATPLAEAILDKKVGSIVTVDVDNPYQVEILAIK